MTQNPKAIKEKPRESKRSLHKNLEDLHGNKRSQKTSMKTENICNTYHRHKVYPNIHRDLEINRKEN